MIDSRIKFNEKHDNNETEELINLTEKSGIKYGIEISYSWGDYEDGLYGEYDTPEEAYEEMCKLAGREAYVQDEEFLSEDGCIVYFHPAEKEIDLHYLSDGEWCYYRIKQHETAKEKDRKIALILLNMQLDMDYADVKQYGKEEVNILEKEIVTLREKDSSLYYVLENIAMQNDDVKILVDGTEVE